MAEPTTIRELFDLPEQIRKGDFVLKLTEGVGNPRATAESYVVTPGLAQAFDQALGLVGSALRDGRSQAAYLHGSFGSGKSHFMALLSLLLAGNEDAWRLAELHALRERHGFVGKTRLLELHFHMIGHESIEAAIFTGYLNHLRVAHPAAALPGLFADEMLFDNAESMLGKLGEQAFFAPMNQGASGRRRLGRRSRPELGRRTLRRAAAARTPTCAQRAVHRPGARRHFQGWERGQQRSSTSTAGLATMARHAAGLGYGGVVLFLDELILWLAGRASDAAWLHAEAQKMVKLVEATDLHRDIPIVSFIARQRNLAELVGEDYAGVENLRLHESLKHWEGRYDTVHLEDRNLPAIVERRILRPKDAAAKATLDDAFEKLKRGAGNAWNTLLGSEDPVAFRRLYPFSPALVDVLVALSNSLQRQRTAIKLLMEMLVEHTEDLALGEVVRVGDLFDVLAAGQDSADGVMRSRFEAAKQIYKYQFLPLIQRSNGTTTAARCQRERPEHPTRIGCSNCPERACRADNRLVKTLLIAALVPEVDVVKDLTASKLVQLNHGSLKVPIPGTEASAGGQKLRAWGRPRSASSSSARGRSARAPAARGRRPRPHPRARAQADSMGARQRVLRDLVVRGAGPRAGARARQGPRHRVAQAPRATGPRAVRQRAHDEPGAPALRRRRRLAAGGRLPVRRRPVLPRRRPRRLERFKETATAAGPWCGCPASCPPRWRSCSASW